MKIKRKYGYCEYDFEKDYVHIYNLFIYPKYRRQGKAKKILQDIIDLIRDSGYKSEIQIVASPQDNSISKEKLVLFYKSMGLKVFDYYG